MSANEDYDGYPPEGFWEELAEQEREQARMAAHWSYVDITANDLVYAANNDAATGISYAIASIQRHALNRKDVRLSVDERDRLLDLAVRARGPILSMMQDRRGKDCLPFVASAWEAVCALIVMWSEHAPWDDRPRELRNDVHKRALWLRQEAYNSSIEADYQQKKSVRAAQIVSDLQAQALEAGRRHG